VLDGCVLDFGRATFRPATFIDSSARPCRNQQPSSSTLAQYPWFHHPGPARPVRLEVALRVAQTARVMDVKRLHGKDIYPAQASALQSASESSIATPARFGSRPRSIGGPRFTSLFPLRRERALCGYGVIL
jgi:hypothetical protein